MAACARRRAIACVRGCARGPEGEGWEGGAWTCLSVAGWQGRRAGGENGVDVRKADGMLLREIVRKQMLEMESVTIYHLLNNSLCNILQIVGEPL